MSDEYQRFKEELGKYDGGVEISLIPLLKRRVGIEGFNIYPRLFQDPEIEVAEVANIGGTEDSSQVIVGIRREPYLKSIARHTDEYSMVTLESPRRLGGEKNVR